MSWQTDIPKWMGRLTVPFIYAQALGAAIWIMGMLLWSRARRWLGERGGW